MKRQLVAIATTLVAVFCLALPANANSDTPPTMAQMARQLADMSEQLADMQAGMSDLTVKDSHALKLNGYFEMAYATDNKAQSPGYFRQHHFSMFFSREWDHWRLFTEVEYEDGATLDGDGSTPVTGAGKINLERGWLDYQRSTAFKLRMGKFLLPHYWNVHHYPNTALTSQLPLMVRKLFPADGTGIMAHGERYRGNLGTTYNVYISNGSSPKPSGGDDNENKASGGHLSLRLADLLPRFDRLDLGASFHNERSPSQGGSMDVIGADLQINVGRFEVLAEYANRADSSTEGAYLQPSFRVTSKLFGVYRYDWYDDGIDPQCRHTLGVAWRPMPNLALKGSGSRTDFHLSGQQGFNQLDLSVAIFF